MRNICHQNGMSLYSPYYKVAITENFSQQNIGSIESPNDNSDTVPKSKESGWMHFLTIHN